MNAYCLHEEYNNGDDALEAYPVGLSQIPYARLQGNKHSKLTCLDSGNLALPEFIGLVQRSLKSLILLSFLLL